MDAFGAAGKARPLPEPEARQGSDHRYQLLVENMEEGVVFHDADGVIRSCNPSAERILRLPAGRLLGRRSVLELCEPTTEDGQPFPLDRCPALESLRTGRSQHGVVVGIRGAGQTEWLSMTSHRLSTGEGGCAGVVTSFRAITEVRNREQLSASREKAAAEHVRLHDEFLATAAHELRTPLTALRLQIQNLLRFTRGQPVVETPLLAQKLTASVKQTERLATLIDLLLDVSRLTAGRLELERAPVSLGLLVQEVVARQSEVLACAPVELRLPAEEVTGRWDASRLEQVVGNLLSNAIKYGGGSPVCVEVGERGGQAILRVGDRGYGIRAADRERVFERFERAHHDLQRPGMGLGLWIVREIVQAHGGQISLESAEGEGSTFTVTLPTGP